MGIAELPPPSDSRPHYLPDEVFEAEKLIHSEEMAKLAMQLVVYRDTLEQHGIEPPDKNGAELLQMWRDCRHVIDTAHKFVMNLGTSKEMLQRWS